MKNGKLDMNCFYETFGATGNLQRMAVGAMVYAIISEPQNRTGYNYSKDNLVRKAIFGKEYDSFMVKMFAIASLSGNELGDVVANELNAEPSYMYKQMFKMLDGIEICEGVCYHSL